VGVGQLQPWIAICINLPVGQLGHSNLAITPVHLQGIDNAEIINNVHSRGAPMVLVHP
jgi:hypothetical protein